MTDHRKDIENDIQPESKDGEQVSDLTSKKKLNRDEEEKVKGGYDPINGGKGGFRETRPI